MEFLRGLGRLLYAVQSKEAYFEAVEDLPEPDYVNQAIPYFITLIALENIILWIRQKPLARLNDGVTSLAHGIWLGCGQLLFRGLEQYAYIKVWENWRIYELPWDSAYTWYAAAVLTDLGYYWVHRASHEINIFWAQHQVHHSSEDLNLTTALRQSAFQGWSSWIFYVPMAFFVPPSVYLIHQQFNLLFQFWIHTELVDTMGPLELVLNTPRHHRIHHGSNRYCLDKNYAGVLIIWDRLFGTFAEEKEDEKIVYGLVEDLQSFNPFWLQFFHLSKIWHRVKEETSLGNKLSVIFKGPGWSAGKGRLGDVDEVPLYPIRDKFDPSVSPWTNAYVVIHFIVTIAAFDLVTKYYLTLSQVNVTLCVGFILVSLTSLGLLLEGRKVGRVLEVTRCLVGALASSHVLLSSNTNIWAGPIVTGFYALSIVAVGAGHVIGGSKETIQGKVK